MFQEIPEYPVVSQECPSLIQEVASLYVKLGPNPDLDGIFNGSICVLRDYAEVPSEIVSHASPYLTHENISYIIAANDSRYALLSGLPYILCYGRDKPIILKFLKKKLGLKVQSLTATEKNNLGVDGIEPSTTAL